MKKISLVALFSMFLNGCFIGERLSNLGDTNNTDDCSVDINNDGLIDDSDCQTKPGDPCAPDANGSIDPGCGDPCTPNADGTIGANCPPPPPPCGCEDPTCQPECNVDTNNDGIIDGSDCGGANPGDPNDPCAPDANGFIAPGCGDPCAPNADGTIGANCPCAPNADGTIDPGCLPPKCLVDTNGDNVIDDSDCGQPIPCEVDTNNDGLIDDSDCTGEPIKPGDPSDPCAPDANGNVGSNCDPCTPNADGSVGPNCE